MKVLFVSSGNSGITALVQAQGQSLIERGIKVDFFPIIGKGLFGYLSNIPKLRKFIRINQPDIVHAHYSLCGIIAAISTRKPVLTSLMGSDVNQSFFMRLVIAHFAKHRWSATIVKSDNMKQKLGLRNVRVIPNGVNLDVFKPLDRGQCQRDLGWDPSNQHILFVSASDPGRAEKNLKLAELAARACEDNSIELHIVARIPHAEMPVYFNASDLLLLTSKWEGSPNVVKEAMACNLPVVSTNVGDVAVLFEGTDGYLISDPNPRSLSIHIKMALKRGLRTQGRGRIMDMGLDSASIAHRIMQVYESLLDVRR